MHQCTHMHIAHARIYKESSNKESKHNPKEKEEVKNVHNKIVKYRKLLGVNRLFQ